MKRKIMILTLCLPLLLGACNEQQAQMEYIGAERAKELALTASGLSTSQVTSFDTDMSSNNGIDYYQVEFEFRGEKYRYDVDALTGVIIDSQLPHTRTSESNNNTVASQSNSSTFDKKLEANSTAVIAVSQQPQNTNTQNTNTVENGKELKPDYNAEYYTPATNSGDNAQTISADDARKLALEQVPGASLNDIKEFEVDYDDGRLEYEGKIYYNQMEYEFEIDGYSGAIRSWDVESIYD